MSNKTCTICQREQQEGSPTVAALLGSEWWRRDFDSALDEEEIRSQDEVVENEDETWTHRLCLARKNILWAIGGDPRVRDLRLQGYIRGMPHNLYMNPPYGAESRAANSYRLLCTTAELLHQAEEAWQRGRVLLPDEIRGQEVEGTLEVADLSMDMTSNVCRYAASAEATAAYAVVLWSAAHDSANSAKRKRKPWAKPVQMFLKKEGYAGTEHEEIVNRLWKVRRKDLAHIDEDGEKASQGLQFGLTRIYPDWYRDWRPFKEVIEHGITLCAHEIKEQESVNVPGGGCRARIRSMNFQRTVGELVHALGRPGPLHDGEHRIHSKQWYSVQLDIGLWCRQQGLPEEVAQAIEAYAGSRNEARSQ